jgi:hypothetical protein
MNHFLFFLSWKSFYKDCEMLLCSNLTKIFYGIYDFESKNKGDRTLCFNVLFEIIINKIKKSN